VDRAAIILVGGLGLTGTLLFCVGLIHFSLPWIVLTLCGGASLGIKSLRAEVREWQRLPSAGFSWPWLDVAVIAIVVLVTAIGGLAQPFGDMNDDAITYHYLGPRVWLRQEVISPVADEVLTFFPVVAETPFAALMAIGGDSAPGLFAIVHLAAALLTAASIAQRLKLDARASLWVAALIAAMPAFYAGTHGGFVDALFAAFVLLSVRFAFEAKRPRELALGGMLCGFAAGTKFTGLIALALVLLCSALVLLWGRRLSFGPAARFLGIAGVCALAAASPFYLRNWIAYGSPIYPPPPGLLHFFIPRGISSEVLREVTKNVVDTGIGMGGDFMHLVLLPFNLTYHTADFSGAGGIGLVPWALGPLGFLACRRDLFARALALFAYAYLLSWFLTAQVSRYLIPVYIIAVIFGVLGWHSVAAMSGTIGRALCAVVVAISISYGLYMILPSRADDVHAALSPSFQLQRQRRDTPLFDCFDFLNRESSVSRVLLLDTSIAPYFVKKEYVKPFGRWGERTVPGVTSVSDVIPQLPNLHVTHILDTRVDGQSFKLSEHAPELTPVFSCKNGMIYRVHAR